MNPPEPHAGQLKSQDGIPAFLEPWHAQVMAMAHLLVESGQITAARWAETLGAEIKAVKDSGRADDSEAYFSAVLKALERLLASDGKVTADEMEDREHAWEHAYLRTPHGQPVTLD